jgi:peroxiredoxin
MINFRKWKRWLINGLLIVTIFVGVTAWQGRNLISKQTPAPSFRLPSLSGEPVALKDLRGRRVLLYFFAPWCKVCDLSISNLNWVRKLWDEESVSIFAVALSYKELQSVEAFLERNTLNVPVLLGNRELLNSYRIRAFPTIYVLNESGDIDGSTVGYSSTIGLWWRTL